MRVDDLVIAVEEALLGSHAYVFSVLEDPATGARFGEDPAQPGSGLIALDEERCVPLTDEVGILFERVAAAARDARGRLDRRYDAEREESTEAAIRAFRATAPGPEDDGTVLDLRRIVARSVHEPAYWRRSTDGVLLHDDPV